MPDDERLVLVDGYAQIYRSFYAVRGLTDSQGRPSNALFGVARFLMKLERELPHGFGAVAFDVGKSAKRTEILPEYKANRPPMPDDLRSQLPVIRQWVGLAGWSTVEREGYEADDLICGVVGVRGAREAVIVSSDKDLAQLVQPDVRLLLPGRKGNDLMLDPDGVVEKYGVAPTAVRDYLALVGDSSDNIPGIPGVGPKTATGLLAEFGTIDGILANIDRVSRKSVREKLAAAGDLLRRNRELVALDAVLPEQWNGLEDIRRRAPDWQALRNLALDYDLKSVVRDIDAAIDAERNPTLF